MPRRWANNHARLPPRAWLAGCSASKAGRHCTIATSAMQIDRSKRSATHHRSRPRVAEQPGQPKLIEGAGAATGDQPSMGRELDDAMLHLRTNRLDGQEPGFLRDRGDAARRAGGGPDLGDVAAITLAGAAEPQACCAGAFALTSMCRRARCFALSEATPALSACWPSWSSAPIAPICCVPTGPSASPSSSSMPSTSACCRWSTIKPSAASLHESPGLSRSRSPWATAQQRRSATTRTGHRRQTISTGKTDPASPWKERAAMSPDALTGLEANLRFCQPGKHGHAHLRASVGLAELDLPTAPRWAKKALKLLTARTESQLRFPTGRYEPTA